MGPFLPPPNILTPPWGGEGDGEARREGRKKGRKAPRAETDRYYYSCIFSFQFHASDFQCGYKPCGGGNGTYYLLSAVMDAHSVMLVEEPTCLSIWEREALILPSAPRPGCCYPPAPSQHILSPSPPASSGGLCSHGPETLASCSLPLPFLALLGRLGRLGRGLGIPVPLCLGASFPVPVSERVGV